MGTKSPRLPAPFCALLLAALVACGRASSAGTLERPAGDPWTGPPLPDLAFVDLEGREVPLASLRGRPLAMDFIFTTCSGPCPALSANMQALQEDLEGVDARLVSISVDPRLDTPEALRDYARRFSADPRRWLFLRGEEHALAELMLALKLSLERAPDGQAVLGQQVTHSTRLVVVDADGCVRGYYDGTTTEGREQAAARLRHLARAR